MSSNAPQSPLSAAFTTAKKQMKNSTNNCLHIVESLQLGLLLIPPAQRSKLALLLRLMKKMIENPYLDQLAAEGDTRTLVCCKLIL